MRSLSSKVICALLVLFAPNSAPAEPKLKIAVLDFGGENAVESRKYIVKFLKKTYEVKSGADLVAACDELGIPMQRGKNLAACAQQLQAVAVVGGKTGDEKLHVAVYSGRTGQPLATGAVAWESPPNSSQISQALRLVGSGLRRAPSSVPKPKPKRPPPAPPPPVTPKAPKKPPARAADELAYDPNQVAQAGEIVVDSGDAMGDAIAEIDPLGDLSGAGGYASDYDTGVDLERDNADDADQDSNDGRKKGDRLTGIEGTAGVGVLARQFSVRDPVGPPLSYSSGLAMAISLALKARPLAFFVDGPAAGTFISFDADFTVGLQSTIANTQDGVAQPSAADAAVLLGTSISEITIAAGWEWLVLDQIDGPRVDFSIGFGALDFTIDWPADVLPQLPNVAYRYVLLAVGGYYPFLEHLSAFADLGYRLVLQAGDIEDDVDWYGDAFVGGIGLGLGLRGDYAGFIFSAEYSYSFFFASFNRGDRAVAELPAASGTSDQYHLLMLNVGYGF